MLVHRKIGTLSHATTHYINIVHFLASKDVCIRSVNERGFMHTVKCTCDIITLLQLENTSSCRVFYSLAPIYVYQHLFYWIEKFVQSFNMWIKKTYVWNWLLSSGCVISVRRTYGRIRKTNVYIYSKKCWICHSMNSFKVLVLERCQQTVRYACYIHTDMCAWEVWVSSENP